VTSFDVVVAADVVDIDYEVAADLAAASIDIFLVFYFNFN